MSDSVPLVFTGQVTVPGIGKGCLPRGRYCWTTMPDHQVQLPSTRDSRYSTTVTEAVHIATTGRPGPVVIDLPKMSLPLEQIIFNPAVNIPSCQPTIEPNELQIKKNLEAIKAKKPVLLAGGGVSYAGGCGRRIGSLSRTLPDPCSD